MDKKLNQNTESKVLLKLLVAFVVDDVAKAVCEAGVLEDVVGKDGVNKLFLKDLLLLLQALFLGVLSQASIAKLKLIKVKAVLKALALRSWHGGKL